MDLTYSLFLKNAQKQIKVFKDGNIITDKNYIKNLKIFAEPLSKVDDIIFFYGNGKLNFDNIPVDFFSSDTIKVFLWEPLMYTSNKAIGFKDHWVRTETVIDDFASPELQSINEWSCKHSKKVIVYVIEKNAELYFSKKYNNIIIKHHPLYFIDMAQGYGPKEWFGKARNTISNYNNHNKIQHKFICPNKRYDPYRQIIASIVCQHTTNMSYNFYNPPLEEVVWFDYKKFCKKYPDVDTAIKKGEKILSSKEFVIDTNNQKTDWKNLYPKNNPYDYDMKTHYKKSFCAIVNETKFATPFIDLSEKTVWPIKHLRPFVIVSAPHSISYLHDFGIKTFSDYWSEEYDNIEIASDRLAAICRLIENIGSYSLEDLRYMYKDMLPLLKHNQKIVQNKISKIVPR
jgi:hypothetical protein